MLSQNCQIVLRGETAREFFSAARHPDLEELERRDEILADMARNFSYRQEGQDLIMDIPDLDLSVCQNIESSDSPMDVEQPVAREYVSVYNLDREFSFHRAGTDLVMDVPNLDLVVAPQHFDYILQEDSGQISPYQYSPIFYTEFSDNYNFRYSRYDNCAA